MVEVLEFKNVEELNDYLEITKFPFNFEIIPISRMFEHPQSKLIVSCITYVLIKQ